MTLFGWKWRNKFFALLLHPSNIGYCHICDARTIFIEYGTWLRDEYKCIKCDSIPRNRALVHALKTFAPDFKDLLIHESSPGSPSSNYLKHRCKNYSCSQYFPDVEPGQEYQGFRCENLEALTLPDQSLDLFITQDVFEHVMHPDKAFAEISRVLKPGGMHIFTMPWYPEIEKTRQRAKLLDGRIQYLEEPIYHGNPVDKEGSLVTFDWGSDLVDLVYKYSRMTITIYLKVDRNLGLDAKFLEVFIGRKPYDQD